MNMNCILLIFLATTLVCSVAEADTQQTVDEICKKTRDITFCKGILAKATTTSPTIKDLLNVTVTEGLRISDDAYDFVSSFLLHAGDERPALNDCADEYAVLNSKLTDNVFLFSRGQYGDIVTRIDYLGSADENCKTNFTLPGYNINPMIEKNKELDVLVAMEKIIGHMVSS